MTDFPPVQTADQALERLLVGNRRYAAMRQVHPRQTVYQRDLLVDGQHPFAAILSCSDSRVPSEIIFDQGLGDLFIVRTAGHVLHDVVLASLEYAVHALRVPLLLVLGHARCGAVQAVLAGQPLPGHLPALVAQVQPALHTIDHAADDALAQAVQANTRYTAGQIAQQSALIAGAVASGRARIASGYYDLATGRVTLLD